MRMSQETTRVEDQEGSRRGREYESSWLGLKLRSDRKEKAGGFLEEPQESGMVHAIPVVGCMSSSHSQCK